MNSSLIEKDPINMEKKELKYAGLKEIVGLVCLIFFLFFFVQTVFNVKVILQENIQQEVSGWVLILFRFLVSIKYVLHWLRRPLLQ